MRRPPLSVRIPPIALPCAAFALLLGIAPPAKADSPSLFTLPVEFGHSAVWTSERSGPLYTASAAVLPGFMFGQPGTFAGRFTLNALGELDYRNPSWDVAAGGRVSFLIKPLINFIPFKLAVEQAYLFRGKGLRFAGGPMLGLGRLVQLSWFGGYETDRKAPLMYIGVGLDVAALTDMIGAITWYVPQGDGGYGL